MNKQIPVNRPMYHHLLPTGIEGFDSLAERALVMRWSTDYMAGLIPSYVGAAVPLESLRTLWR